MAVCITETDALFNMFCMAFGESKRYFNDRGERQRERKEKAVRCI